MGLVPEFFMLLGIDIFLAVSILCALLDEELPSRLQYFFQVAATVGVGQLVISQQFSVFTRDPTDPTRFWVSVVYLALAVSTVVGLNVYLGAVRRKMALASTFLGAVTMPILMTSALFLSSFLAGGGELTFTPVAIATLAFSALFMSLCLFAFLREASKQTSNPPSERRSPSTGPLSTPPSVPGIAVPLRLTSSGEEDWEESPKQEKDGK
jgi:hypothetical protein